MRIELKHLVAAALLLLSHFAMAEEPAAYVWESDSGVQAVSGCQTYSRPATFDEKQTEFSDEKGQWFAAMGEDSQFLFLRCPFGNESREYLLYDVYSNGDFVARIGADPSVDRPVKKAFQTASRFGVAAVEGALEYVVCIAGAELNVRDESLSRVAFTMKRFESVKPMQSWDQNKKQKTINGKAYTFIKVQAPSKPEGKNVGWVAENFVRLKAECPGAAKVETPVVNNNSWTFPTISRPSESYKTGMRKFRASRSGGARLHAACDLYRVKDERALSVNSGKVLRGLYYFYQGTYAIEVRHTGGKVVRYGEVTGKKPSGTGQGSVVTSGQTIGYIGKVNSGCCNPMLHFEMYAGTAEGPLTTSGNKFNRRKDLVDPTSPLSDWENAKFGKSW